MVLVKKERVLEIEIVPWAAVAMGSQPTEVASLTTKTIDNAVRTEYEYGINTKTKF